MSKRKINLKDSKNKKYCYSIDDSSDDDCQYLNNAFKNESNVNNLNQDSDEDYVDLAFEFEKKLNNEDNQLIDAALNYDNPLYKINREITKEVKKFNYTLKIIEYFAINPKANNFIDSIKDTKQFIENLVA